ncbi:LytTR family DNA-binding domain-containing protein [Draconibacterium sp. IB214405]|uniref:LytR/AlgR family response regulator transcription factor n=1 Tax=Draconibacterium sp. IB214405 TaxID=3097352 RepID=UPI002A0CDB65|nr:LytTR family DNA-binding domain-containing protein [Draconibacterium sp. IB214405]MDX8338972.1 LytTR family DNA-binding domain-containing protein [Draconibacterium sp. IB214405]
MIRTIAIDDEPLALQLVTSYVEKTPMLTLAGAFDNPIDAMEFLDNNEVDLIFLDIEMPDLNGLEFTRILTNKPKIIFTTAYEKYALQGFKLDAVDYLLKPFSYEEFYKAAEKAKKQIGYERADKNNDEVEANHEFLFLKSEYKIRRINFNDIIYIEGLKDYVKVYLQNETKPIMSLSSLKALEAKLPEEKFMRVHRSFIVNLEKIDTIERSRIVFGKVYIPVSEQYKEAFNNFVKNNFL